MDTAQYEIFCYMFGLDHKPKQDMFVLYFNGNAAQFPADNKDVDLVREFRKLGWVPLDARLDEFLKINPYNQDALAIKFSAAPSKLQDLALASRRTAMPATIRARLPQQNRDRDADDKEVALFIDTLKLINELKSHDWLLNASVRSAIFVLGACTNAPILKENKELQKEVQSLLESLGKEIVHYPYSYSNYGYWAGISAIAKDPNPQKLLDRIKFYPISTNGYGVHDFISQLAEPFFVNPLAGDDLMPIVDDGFKFMDYGAQWMIEQDFYLDGLFDHAFAQLAVAKAKKLIMCRRFSELEKHLQDIWQLVGPNWATVVSDLKSPSVRSRGEGLNDLPDANKKRVDEILDLTPRPAAAKPPTAAESDASDGISPDRKKLNDLERFIRLNPDAYYAMDMYCRDAAKLLPDEDLEKNIYNYTKITHTPPSLAAYSKI